MDLCFVFFLLTFFISSVNISGMNNIPDRAELLKRTADVGRLNGPGFEDDVIGRCGEPVKVPLVIANKDTLKGYGEIVPDLDSAQVEIVPWPAVGTRPVCPGSGIGGGVVGDEFLYRWHGDLMLALNLAVNDGLNVTGRLPLDVSSDNRTHVLVRDAGYHPDGGQVFFPRDGDPFVALLALPGDDVKPEDFVAFYFDGTCGFNMKPNVWHQPLYPTADTAVYTGKQGAVHACVVFDSVEEYGKFMLVPLKP